MFFTLDKLKKEIRIALDQNNSSALLEGVGDIDTLTVEEIITSKIVNAVRMVTIDAPSYLLDGESLLLTVSLGRANRDMVVDGHCCRMILCGSSALK